MPRRAASFAMASSSPSEMIAPVGLSGELRMIPRVRGVNAARIVSAFSAKPSSGCERTITGVASASLICSTRVGQPGMWVITSSPGPKSASTLLKSACLPPAEQITSDERVLDAVVDLVALDDRALEILGAGVVGVLGEVGVDRAVRGGADVGGRRKVRLPRPEIDHVDSLGFHLHGVGRHLHRRGHGDPAGTCGESHRAKPSGFHARASSRAGDLRQ